MSKKRKYYKNGIPIFVDPRVRFSNKEVINSNIDDHVYQTWYKIDKNYYYNIWSKTINQFKSNNQVL